MSHRPTVPILGRAPVFRTSLDYWQKQGSTGTTDEPSLNRYVSEVATTQSYAYSSNPEVYQDLDAGVDDDHSSEASSASGFRRD